MNLEDVLKAHKRYVAIAGPLNAMNQDPNSVNNPDVFESYLSYLQKYQGLTSEQAEAMRNSDNISVRQVITNARIREQEDSETLVGIVEQNYDGLIKKLSDDKLVGFAISLPEKGKKYLDLMKALQGEDYSTLRRLLVRDEDCKEWKLYIQKWLNDQELKEVASMFIVSGRKHFQNKKLSDEKVRDGKKYYAINGKKTRQYITDTIAGYKPEARVGAYMGLASLYAQKN